MEKPRNTIVVVSRVLGRVREVVNRGYLTALFAAGAGMVVAGFIRPLIVFSSMKGQGLLWVAFLTAGFMLARAFSSILSGVLVGRRGYFLTGLAGFILWFLSLSLYMFTPSLYYPVVRVLEGFSAGLLWPAMQALVVSSVPQWFRARGLSIYFVSSSLLYYLAVWLGGFVESWWGSSGLFYSSLVLLATTIAGYALLASGVKWEKKESISVKYIFSHIPRTLDLIPLALVMGGVGGLGLDYLLAYSKSVSGFSSELARAYWSYAGYLGLVLSLLLSYVADKVGGEAINYVAALVVAVSLLAISIPLPPLLLYTLVSLPVVGGRVFKPIFRKTVVDRIGSGEVGIALTNFLTNIGASAAPLIVVLINTVLPITGLNIGLITYSVVSLAILIYMLLAR